MSGGRRPMRIKSANGRSPEVVHHLPPERISPFKPAPADVPPPVRAKIYENPIETAFRVDELLKEIETLKIERDAFEREAKVERAKN